MASRMQSAHACMHDCIQLSTVLVVIMIRRYSLIPGLPDSDAGNTWTSEFRGEFRI